MRRRLLSSGRPAISMCIFIISARSKSTCSREISKNPVMTCSAYLRQGPSGPNRFCRPPFWLAIDIAERPQTHRSPRKDRTSHHRCIAHLTGGACLADARSPEIVTLWASSARPYERGVKDLSRMA
jgi:hypothetical protein